MPLVAFDYPADLRPFNKQAQRVLTQAHALGWSLHWLARSKNVAQVTSPGREKSFNVPTTNISDNRIKSFVRALTRYTDPEVLAEYADKVRETTKTVVDHELHPTPAPRTAIPRPKTAVAAAMEEASQVVKVKTEKPNDHVQADAHIVSERPWVAHASGDEATGKGQMYESPYVVERTWSNGKVDYKCTTCEYTAEKPRSVSSHNATRADHPKGSQSKAKRFSVLDYEGTGKKHERSAVTRLRSDLLRVLDSIESWQSLSREELAARLAERVYEERPEREALAPLTPEQVIERITYLVDGGRYADMHKQIDSMTEALRVATEKAEAAEHEVIRLREERRALASMLAEEQEDKS